MSEDLVKIEVNGRQLEARKGQMLIEATDAAGITVPRFCYHKKLSVAANCRMCLVEVEKAPKPLPACATPVMDGMKVHTQSPKAIAAQKSTMEFLLINHPLDCPICDQGGECELQDVAMGYGGGVSQFTERKRVVKDKDIGPLIKTEMTRCIHCTRCVRFGEEIAGLRELGATGRGEHMQIGTYIEKSLVSELSGNVIDLCPVGALTSKPARYEGRSWEYYQYAGIAPHDSVGSNLFLHVLRNRVMRVVPRENEAVNETWISDRDRFSYEGLYSADRATTPLLRRGKALEESDWEEVLEAAAKGLQGIINKHGPEQVGVLISPNATLEEMYLLQKLARGLGITAIDHRLRQADFSDQEQAPAYPWLGMDISDLESLNGVLLVGSNPRQEQPLFGHRLRKAALAGAHVSLINPRHYDFTFPVADQWVTGPQGMVAALGAVAAAVAESTGTTLPEALKPLAGDVQDRHKAMAESLIQGERRALLLGNLATAHPALSQLRALGVFIARASGATLGYLPEAANAVGGWLAGALPHRQAGAKAADKAGFNALEMVGSPRKAYVLLGVEPEYDCWDGAAALKAVQGAEFVLNLTPYASAAARGYSSVLLPTAAFAETFGTFVNAEGTAQSFQGATKPPGEARPGWKVLRVLGGLLGLEGFDYLDGQQVLDQVLEACGEVTQDNLTAAEGGFEALAADGLWRVAEVPLYAGDALVRRAPSLQQTAWARPAAAYVHPQTAADRNLKGDQVKVKQGKGEAVLPLVVDERVAPDTVMVPAALEGSLALGPMTGPCEIRGA